MFYNIVIRIKNVINSVILFYKMVLKHIFISSDTKKARQGVVAGLNFGHEEELFIIYNI